ncbi:STAS domain-containing protein [Amycolatopsis anabasis]|uniref:STAS domain-containing protein n=1 Tax=Amycolatopsis anabasis TaxID=1840409 RepID=UPI00131B11E4|nr:STAS domain-containing protein [Amycolatopsis anabasis]
MSIVSEPQASDVPMVEVVVEERGRGPVLIVRGEINHVTAPQLAESVALALGARPAVLVVDLTGVVFMTSAALTVLVAAHHACGKGTALRIVATGRPLRTLEITGLAEVFTLYPTLSAAEA